MSSISGCFGAFHIHVNFPALGRKKKEQQSISRRLEELRGQRKEKTVQFRELLAQKLVNSSLIQLLERKGLK